MKYRFQIVFAILVAVAVAADAPKPTPVNDAGQLQLLKAQHALDDVKSQEAGLQSQGMAIQNQMTQLQQQYSALQAKEKDATTALETAKTNVLKDAGLDVAKWDVNVAKLQFDPKAAPAAPVASPAK